MAKVTSRTVRVTDIPQEVDREKFLKYAQQLSSKSIDRKLFSPAVQGSLNPTISFSPQFDGHVGTITLPSEKHKLAALNSNNSQWRLDDIFNGVTILFCPKDADLDICAVHGLNGNAFDTWVAESNNRTTMWLRDLLPTTSPFEKARIMTFGYSSQLSDRQNLSGINEWSHHLLECLSNVRISENERNRPILIVCHSLGGLVARQAMIRLNEYDKPSYQGLSLKCCGLLFLSTPHSGSKEADWNEILVGIAKITFGVRSETLDHLRAFNPSSSESQDQFANLKPKPPFEALHETLRTKVKGFSRHIVTRQSASLNNMIASSMADVDHRTICKFDGKFGGFMQVIVKLRYLKDLLMDQAGGSIPDSKRPWLPPPTAPSCPLPRNKKFFEGQGLYKGAKLKGRQTELKSLTKMMDAFTQDGNLALAVTGIGGIGKTATMVEIAHQQEDRRNVFFVHANNKSSLDKAYCDIARRIGPEYLMKEFKGRDVEGIWRSENSEEKVERFKSWLNDPENEDALLLFDDIDGVEGLDERGMALPHEAKNILYTTRDPVFSDLGLRSRRRFRLSPMDTEDIIKIMEGIRDQEMVDRQDDEKTGDLYQRKILLQIAESIYGHPLAASVAIKYIVRVISQDKGTTAGEQFITKLQSDSFEERRRFLDFSPEIQSIMDTFNVSQKRLRQPEGEAWRLLQFHGMIETETSDDFDPREFFSSHTCPIIEEDFPDADILGAESFHLRGLFSELEAVSFGERFEISKPMAFHPLWLECTRHAMGPTGRLRYARQVLQVCYHSIFNQGGKISHSAMEQRANTFLTHARRCLEVCTSFKISSEELDLPEPIQRWTQYLAPSHEK